MNWKLISGSNIWEIWEGEEKQDELSLPFLQKNVPQSFTSRFELDEWLEKEEKKLAKNKVLRLLAMRNYPTVTLFKKLHDAGYRPAAIEKIVRWAEEMGYVQDDEYIRSAVLQEAKKGYGPPVIAWKMRIKGFSEPMIEQALRHATLAIQREGIKKILKKFSDKRKAVRALLRRGYALSFIKTQLNREIEETE